MTCQCEQCFKYCTAAGAHLEPQPRWGHDAIGIPEMLVCVSCQTAPPSTDAAIAPAQATASAVARPKTPSREIISSSQADYASHGAGHSQNTEILAHLQKYFGQWFNRKWIRERFGAEAVNTRMSVIRQWVKGDGLDVDQKSYAKRNGKVHSYYRLCRIEDSERLARLRQREQAEVAP